MPFDPDALLALPPAEGRVRITPTKAILYALGVGAEDLAYVYEAGLRALPTMAQTLATPAPAWRDPRHGVDWQRVLHGGTSLTLHAPLPIDAQLIVRTALGPIFDKGSSKGAILIATREIATTEGQRLATIRDTILLRGNGGFGGDPGAPAAVQPPPDRAPDAILALPTAPNQALIYRLSGDMNPLHIDPAVAHAAGFERPILHGLCTFGIAGRALLALLADGEPDRIRRIDARFSSPVYPGETIVTEIWRDGPGRAFFRAITAERGTAVLSDGTVEFEA